MKFRINTRFHKALRTKVIAIERDILTDRDTLTCQLGFLEFDTSGEIQAIKSTKKIMMFPAPIRPDITTNQPFKFDFDYRVETSPYFRLAVPNIDALNERDGFDTWKTNTSEYFNWLTDDATNPHKYFSETRVLITDRLVENRNTLQEQKYRVSRVEIIGTLQDIYLHNLNDVA